MDNQIPGLAPSQQRNGRKLKSICDRMRKKDGRIRGNLNGKRVDQSARSVITPDPFISIDELGVPIKIALNITFQEVVNEYNIDRELIDAFLKSMEMDLYDIKYDTALYNEYIYGSAEVVGLMCLRVFCKGNDAQYQSLVKPARALGAAFQKINFLRDIKSDYQDRGRVYFPDVDFLNFSNEDKLKIEQDIKADFDLGYEGIKQLPKGAKLGVYIAYIYYIQLFKKIKSATPSQVLSTRIRVPDKQKLALLFTSYFRFQLNAI
jgi:phytoene/squalene synthetase